MITSRPILITGINGYVASTIAVDLLKKGYKIRGTVRNITKVDKFDHLYQLNPSCEGSIEIVEADLFNAQDWDTPTRGVDYVIHVATVLGDNAELSDDAKLERDINASLHVLDAALKNGVRKVVRTLGCLSMIPSDKSVPVSEDSYQSETHFLKNAILEEKAVWQFYKKNLKQLAITTLHPALILGPRLADHHKLSMRILEDFINRKIEGTTVSETYLPIVDVRNVCRAHVNALLNPETDGKRYLIANKQPYSLSDLLDLINEAFDLDLVTEKLLTPEKITDLMTNGSLTAFYIYLFNTWPTEFINTRSIEDLGLNYIDQATTIIDSVRSIIN